MNAPQNTQGASQKYHLFVDSRDRNPQYASAFDFRVDLQDIGVPVLRGVTSLVLKMCTIPKCASEDYALLDLGYNDNNLLSTDSGCPFPSMFLYYDSSWMPAGGVKVMKDFQPVVFNPRITLSSLKIKLKKHGGAIMTPSDTSNSTNCSFLFEVHTETFKH